MNGLPRRTAVLGALCTVCTIGGCARYGSTAAPPPEGGGPTTPAESDGTPAAGDGAQPRAGLASTGDIPVGGGKVLADEQVVITQPAAGEFKAFSAVCTHQGCLVSEVANETINCTCHGSKFRIADGSVADGPANQPLPTRAVTVTGDQISLA